MEARVNTRSVMARNQMAEKSMEKKEYSKRSADHSPDSANKKRSVLCNITNTNPNVISKKEKLLKGAKVTSTSLNNDEENYMEEETGFQDSGLCEDVKPMNDEVILIDSEEEDDVFDMKPMPPGVVDFDATNIGDIYSESHHAPYIFHYYRQREKKFVIKKYLLEQPELTRAMRAVLVDWLVEVQESFELNHETLYLAVKLVDIYLMQNVIRKSNLQLVGATAVLIASKYDERLPPLVDDFLYICDDSYTRSEMLTMEINILRAVDFDLGIPISYRFLRRYARCSGATMDTLTLARYILETSLMDYEFIDIPDSKMAAAVLFLALKMKKLGGWNATLEYYSGYKSVDLIDLAKLLNKMISSSPNKNLLTVHAKYSHKIFFEVAKVPPLKNADW